VMKMKNIFRKSILILPALVLLLLAQGCSYQEALRGRHENDVGSHHVVVIKPCGLFSENTTKIENVPGHTMYEYTCGETRVAMMLKDGELTVNDKNYGAINEGDSITFDHGKVLINSRETQEVASK